MKRNSPRQIPFAAVPVTLFGEAACTLADELGIPVSTYALRGERPMSTTNARVPCEGRGAGQQLRVGRLARRGLQHARGRVTPLRITPPHGYYRPDHLAQVIVEMRVRGAPYLRAYHDREADIWHAREGTHRLRAAKALGLVPVLVPVPWPHTRAALVRARHLWDRHGHVFDRLQEIDVGRIGGARRPPRRRGRVMSTPSEPIANAPAPGRCACPRLDDSDCAAVRYGRDLRLLLDGDDYHDDPDFDPCGCMCHDQEETDDDDE